MGLGFDLGSVLSDAHQVLNWMRQHGVSSFEFGGFRLVADKAISRPVEVNLDPESVMAQAGVFADVDGSGMCSCGHTWVEHTHAGCLHGCSHDVCVSEATVDPVEE